MEEKAGKKRCTREEDNSCGLFIPDDVLVEILVRLPLLSIIICNSVSKPWNRLISDHSFPTTKVSNLPPTHLLCRICDHRLIGDWDLDQSENMRQVDFSTIGVYDIDNDDNPPPQVAPLNM